MKAFLLAIIAVASLDAVANHSDGVRACWALMGELIERTQRDVGESVYRR